MNKITSLSLLCILLFSACNSAEKKKEREVLAKQPDTIVSTAIGDLQLPPPYETKSVTLRSAMKKWPNGKKPIAPQGFVVTKFAENLKNPRNTYVAPNGDILVAESNTSQSANQITLFRDADKDGKFEVRTVFLNDLNQPYGMLVLNNYFYVANTDGLYRYPYSGQSKMKSTGVKILELPAGGYNNHWTRNLLASADGSKIYVSVGSGSNVGENGMQYEKGRACIIEINPDGSGRKIYAGGLRNPVGMDWNPVTGELWAVINERDGLGDDLVPDFLTSVKKGGFYGWPYTYFGGIPDPRIKPNGEAPRAIVPDVPLGAHTASLGLAFYTNNAFPEKYRNGAFVGQHGSWNRSVISGYKVVFIPFANGKPTGPAQDFVTGFIANQNAAKVYGRPVDVTILPNGSLLVNDDSGNAIWQVTYKR